MKPSNSKLWFTIFAALALGTIGCNKQQAPAEQAPANAEPEAAAPAAPAPAQAQQRKTQQGRTRQSRAPQTSASQQAAPRAAAPIPRPTAEQPRVRTARIEAGTPLRVRTTTALSTNTVQTGQTFTATLEEPLTEGGWVVAPKGSQVEGRVVEADKGGRVKGRASLAIQLTSLSTADGQNIAITTSPVSREAQSTKKKDAVKVGIGAGIGAAIGAIAGGGKGAAIGAGAGAGAGTGAVLATRGDPAVIPAETVLTFELAAPVVITERR